MRVLYSSTLIYLLSFILNASSINAHSLKESIIINREKGKTGGGRFSLAYPQILKDAPLRNIKRINNLLKKTLVDEKICETDLKKQTEMYINTDIELSLINESVLSFSSYYEGYCGGPYEDHGVIYYNLDLKHAKWLDIQNSLSHQHRFKHFLFKKFQQNIPKNTHPDCKHLYEESEMPLTYFEYLLVPLGLKARLSYAHVARACEFSITLDCKALKPFIKKESLVFSQCLNKS